MLIENWVVRWGMIGCGDVAEVKSGPGFQKALGSSLVAVHRRDVVKANEYARRHTVARVHNTADELIADPGVDAVYIATPPSSHCDLALRVAAAGKPCLVEKPMAMNHEECLRMSEAFRLRDLPLWVAFYRRGLERFLVARRLLTDGAIGQVTSVDITVSDELATGERAGAWRFDPAIAGAGLFFDLGSHCLDLVDFLVGEIEDIHGFAINTGGRYATEDVTTAAFVVRGGVVGTGVWNFNAGETADGIRVVGTAGRLHVPVFHDGDLVCVTSGREQIYPVRNPPHVHQPLIQSIVDELHGRGRCESRGDNGARAAWALDRCVAGYYAGAN